MELPEDVSSTPGLTPDTLSKQAARSLANQLINITLPALTKYWEGEIKPRESVIQPKKRVPNKRTLIKHLQSVQQWYHNDEYLCSHGSYLRQLVGVACAEALPFYLADDDCELIFMLTIQLMFCQEAGFFSQSRELYDTRVSRSYGEFLQFLVPFHIESLYTTCINFQNPMPVLVLIKNSPYLRDVHLYKNLSDHVLTNIRKHCPYLESITLSGHNVVTEEYLFRTFFSGKGKEQVKPFVEEKENLPLSFPSLKSVNMLMDLDNDHIMFFIQYFYSNVKTSWTKCIAENRLNPYLLKTLLGPPWCLKGKGSFQVDVLELTIRKSTLDDWTMREPSLIFPIVKHISIFHSFHDTSVPKELSEKINDIVERLQCTSFSHSSPPNEDYIDSLNICVPVLKNFGLSFTELHISTFEVLDAKILFKCLNMCPNLKIFSINASRIEMNTDPFVNLDTLTNLNSLGMSVKTLCSSDVSCLTHILRASPNLKAIELFGANLKTVVQDLTTSGILDKIQIISLHKSFSWFTDQDLDYCIFLGRNLSSLSVLMLNPILRNTLFLIKSYFANSQLKIIHRYKLLIS